MNAPVQAAAAPMVALLNDPNVCPEFKRALTAGDVLADAGSRSIPYFLVTTVEGVEIERQQVKPTTIRAHANRAQRWSRLAHEFEYGENGEVVGAVTKNEITRIER